jgi:hypothetical protein
METEHISEMLCKNIYGFHMIHLVPRIDRDYFPKQP